MKRVLVTPYKPGFLWTTIDWGRGTDRIITNKRNPKSNVHYTFRSF